jgi:phosphoglycerol transferase MdoB-like AlkP superfamily enzyme
MQQGLTAETACYLGSRNRWDVIQCDVQYGKGYDEIWQILKIILLISIPMFLVLDWTLRRKLENYKGYKRLILFILVIVFVIFLLQLTTGMFIFY